MSNVGESGPTVLDATVLSNFAHVSQLSLLEGLPRAATVPIVRDEIERGVKTHPYLERATSRIGFRIPVVAVTEADRTLESTLRSQIDPGEAQALAVADIRRGTLVTDDGDARTVARERNVPITGSIGVLLWAVERNLVGERTANRWLERWVDEGGFHAPSRSLQDYR